MKVYLKLAAIIFVTTLISCGNRSDQSSDALYSHEMVEKRAMKTFLSNKREQQLATAKWDYVPGLVANSVLKAWLQYPEKTEYYDIVKAYADHCLQSGDTVHVENSNIDDLAAGKIFFALYQHEMEKGNTGDAQRYRNCVTHLRNKLKYNHERISSEKPGAGGFFHKARYPNQMWLDGLYMGTALYAEWQHNFGEELGSDDNLQSWTDIANQFKIIHQYTYDSEKKLNYHGWSAAIDDPNSFWAKKDAPYKGCSPEFWGRGVGWYFAALVDVLELMPKSHNDYPALVQITKEVADGLVKYQDPESGCWYQLLQYNSETKSDNIGDSINDKVYNIGDKTNYVESSASSMFTYAFLKGIRLGVLNQQQYLSTAEKAYKGLLKTFVRNNENGELDIIQSCASAGLGPQNDLSRTGTINYYLCGKDVHITQNEGKAIGPFIMASLEWELLGK